MRSCRTKQATWAVKFINNLTHTKGKWAGQPFNLRPWQERIVRELFGRVRKDGLRRYRTCYVEIPRKNGKSELAAAIALLCLLGDEEMGAEVYSAAADREQASLVFNVAAQMVRNDPELEARVKIIDSQKRIVDYRTGSFYRAISAEAYTKHGYNASAIIYDELHAAPNRDLWDVLTTSVGARTQPLTFAITTAGWDRNSVCWELRSYADRVLEGVLKDPTFLPVIYSAPQDADWQSEKVWRKYNPALGDFRSLEELQVSAKQAEELPARQNVFRRLYLCQWTEQAERWLDMGVWDENAGAVVPEALRGRPCYGGLDLASTRDVAALVLLFPPEEGDDIEEYVVLSFFWVPGEAIQRRVKRDRVPYDVWVREERMKATEGDVTDYDVIREDVKALAETYQVRAIAYDRWNASQLVTQLGGDGAQMVPFGQGFVSMAAPTRELEKIILGRRLRHGGHPVLRWMASNVAVKQDSAGNMKIDKKKSTEKVDGMVALAMALGIYMNPPEHDGPSVYDDAEARPDGILTLDL